MIPFKFHLKYLLFWFFGFLLKTLGFLEKTLGFLERALLKTCFKMKDEKENSVQWTDWDSNRECLEKVDKHSSSTKIITVKTISASYQVNALTAIHIKIHHTSLIPNPLGQTSFITGINFAISFRVC